MPFETDKSNGFKLDASELLKTGVYPETFDRQIPFWESVDGVQYTEFGMRRKSGRIEKNDYTAQGSSTDIRGLIAVKEEDDKVAYIADLNQIYSYRLKPTQTSAEVDTVGTGYNLLADAVATSWDTAVAFDDVQISSGGATISSGVCTITTSAAHGFIVGSVINVVGLTDSLGSTVGGDNTIVTAVGASNVFSFSTAKTGTVTIAGSPPSASAYVEFTQTTWIDSGQITTWDETINVPEQWSLETFGQFVVGASGSHKAVIKKNNINFNTFFGSDSATPTGNISGVFINASGAGYAVGETITNMTASVGSNTVDLKVTAIGGSGEVTAVEVTDFGAADYTNSTALSGGTESASGDGNLTCTVTVPSFPYEKVKIFKRQGPHLLAFNYSTSSANFKTSFSWCSADNLDVWNPQATNTAGSLQIREADGEIVCVAQLGSNLAVYTENQLFLVSYVGLPNIFGYSVGLVNGVGAVSPNSVVSVGRKNYGLCRDGFFVTDGTRTEMIGRSNGINEYFRKNVATDQMGKVYAFDNSKENEVCWALPINNSNISQELYYNYKTNQWGMRTSILTAYLTRGVFNESLSADSSGKFYFEANSPFLSSPAVTATTKAHDLNNADRVKEITALRVGKEGSGIPTVSVGFTDTIDATPTYLDKDKFTVDDTFKSFPVRTAGRYIHLKVESNGANDDWELTDMIIQGRFEGER